MCAALSTVTCGAGSCGAQGILLGWRHRMESVPHGIDFPKSPSLYFPPVSGVARLRRLFLVEVNSDGRGYGLGTRITDT